MHGMYDVTSGCSFTIVKYCSEWQNWQVGALKRVWLQLDRLLNLSDHGDKQETWTLTTVCEE